MQEMQKTQVQSLLGLEDPLEKETAIHYSLENSMDSEAWRATVHGLTKSHT